MATTCSQSDPGSQDGREDWFATTHWSVVLAAREDSSPGTAEALEKLCRAYWSPLYAYIRRRGYSPHDAQDLTQEFFARLLEKNYLGSADRSKGKFRSFLLASLNHFLANEWDKAHTAKRGGKITFVSIEEESAERQYLQDAVSGLSPEKLYEQRWAAALLAQVLARLREDYSATGKAGLFDELKVFLTGEKSSETYAALSTRLGMTEGALKMAVQRMRIRCRELLRSEVAHTVASPNDVEDELRSLLSALS